MKNLTTILHADKAGLPVDFPQKNVMFLLVLRLKKKKPVEHSWSSLLLSISKFYWYSSSPVFSIWFVSSNHLHYCHSLHTVSPDSAPASPCSNLHTSTRLFYSNLKSSHSCFATLYLVPHCAFEALLNTVNMRTCLKQIRLCLSFSVLKWRLTCLFSSWTALQYSN